jgi:predicted dehydrogenase
VLDDAKDYDAVVVSTCEHTHAFATLPALQLGKHVYCEKPLTHGVWEARVVTEASKKAKVATQMGTQAHANDTWRRVVELVQSGAIGKVTEATSGSTAPGAGRARGRGDVQRHRVTQDRPKERWRSRPT